MTEKGLPESAHADAEAAREQRQKKLTKCLLYVVLFVVFQTAVITLFALTVMKVKTPKFRVHGATFTSFNTGAGALQATMDPQFSVKNTNFGSYKYSATAVEFFYGDAKIGEASVPNSKLSRLDIHLEIRCPRRRRHHHHQPSALNPSERRDGAHQELSADDGDSGADVHHEEEQSHQHELHHGSPHGYQHSNQHSLRLMISVFRFLLFTWALVLVDVF